MRLSKISRYAAFLLALILTLSGLSATAEGISSAPAAGSQTVAQLLQILDFKFFVREDGIRRLPRIPSGWLTERPAATWRTRLRWQAMTETG